MSDVVNYSLLINFFLVLGANLSKCAENAIADSTALETDTPTKKCYGRFGCYSLDNPWNSFMRPVAMFPQSPEYINPKYCLYTRRNPQTCDPLFLDDAQTLFRSNYVPSGQVYFIVHGFLDNGNRPWLKEARDKLEVANENIRSDLERWSQEKKNDLKNILITFAEQHISHYEQCLRAWNDVAIQNPCNGRPSNSRAEPL